MLNHDKIIFAWRYAKNLLLKDLAYRVGSCPWVGLVVMSKRWGEADGANVKHLTFYGLAMFSSEFLVQSQ